MFKVITPPTNDPLGAKKLARAVQNAMNACAKGAKVDFRVTTRTWDEKPEFTIDDSQEDKRIVGTDDDIYTYTDQGTRPHIIRPRRAKRLAIIGINSRPKTKPFVIGSVQKNRDNTNVYTTLVQHPGTKARSFSIAIRDKWSRQMIVVFERAIQAAMQGRE